MIMVKHLKANLFFFGYHSIALEEVYTPQLLNSMICYINNCKGSHFTKTYEFLFKQA